MLRTFFYGFIWVSYLVLISGCKKEKAPPPPPPITFDTTLTRYYSDLNTMGVYVGKTAPEAILEQMSNNFYQETLKKDSAIACAIALKAKYIRLNLFKDLWADQTSGGGREFFLDYYKSVKDARLLPVLNVNYHQSDFSSPEPFPEPAVYNTFLKEVLDSLNAIQWKPAVIIVENEEANLTQYLIDTSDDNRMYADMQKYVDQLAGAIEVGSSFVWWDGSIGVEVTNGGLLTRSINYVVWDWFKNSIKDEGLANYYASKSFGPTLYKQIYKDPQPLFISKRIKLNKYLESKLNLLPMKYVNIHWTEPIASRAWNDNTEGMTAWDYGISPDSLGRGVLDLSVLYYHKTMPTKKLISNEISQLSYSSILMQQLVNKVVEHPFEAWNIVTFYSADGSNPYLSKGLHNTIITSGNPVFSYSLRDNGIVLENNLKFLK